MRKIEVKEECMGCGQCILNTKYLEENEEGKPVFADGMDVSDEDVDEVRSVIDGCPVNALSLVELTAVTGSGRKVLNEIIEKLEKDISEVNIPRITTNDIKFIPENYSIPAAYSNKEYDARYNSEGQARSAARSEFQSLMYSESAYRPMLKQVFVEYKVNVLKPYYTYENNDSSYYYKFNHKYAEKLSIYYSDLQKTLGDEFNLSDDWKKFEVYPATGKGSIESEIDEVRFFDERSTSSGIIAEMKSSSYTSLDYYMGMMDFDYYEEYVGEGMFGRSKMKKKWSFSGFSEAANEFVKDLKDAIRLADPGIEGNGENAVNNNITRYENKVKSKLKEKLSQLKQLI